MRDFCGLVCICGNVTAAAIQVALCRKFQGLSFIVQCAVKILGANACAFVFSVKCM